MIAWTLVETLIAQFALKDTCRHWFQWRFFLRVNDWEWRGRTAQRIIFASSIALTSGHSVSMMLKRTELRLRPSGMMRS